VVRRDLITVHVAYTTAFMLTLAALGRSDDTRTVEDPEEESPLETRGRTASVSESAVAKEEQR